MGNLFKRSTGEDQSADQATMRLIKQLVEIPRAEFEQLVVELYQAAGHAAKRVGGPGDRDFDIVIVSKAGQHWIAQCKQWRGAVGESVVREFYAAMSREHAAEGALITTARFTRKAREWAQDKPIHLYDGPAFLHVWQRIQGTSLETFMAHGSNGSDG